MMECGMMVCEKCGTLLIDGKCPNCLGLENQKSKNRNMAIFAVILSVVSIGLLVGGFFALSSPMTIALQSISNWSSLLKKGLENDNSQLMENFSSRNQVQMDTRLLFEVNPMLSLGFEEFELKFTCADDRKNDRSKVNLQMLLGENGIGLDGILADHKLYLKIQDVLEQYHYLDMDFSSFFQPTDNVSYEKLIDIVFDNIKKNVDSGSFKKSKETISLGDRTKKTTKISYKVTTKKFAHVLIDILEDIKNDKDLMTMLEKTYAEGEESFSSQIELAIQELKTLEKQKDQPLFYYNIYYYGFNNIVMEEFADDDVAIQFYHYDRVNEFKVTDIASKMNYFTLKIEDKKDEKAISGFILTYPYQGTYTKKGTESSLKIELNLYGQSFIAELVHKEKDEKDSFESQDQFTLDMKADGTILEDIIKITTNVQYVFDQKVDVSGIEEAKPFEEMSVDDQAALLDAIESHPFISSIIQLFGNSDVDFGDSDLENDDFNWDLDDEDLDMDDFDL